MPLERRLLNLDGVDCDRLVEPIHGGNSLRESRELSRIEFSAVPRT
jgi:hypothetical protein